MQSIRSLRRGAALHAVRAALAAGSARAAFRVVEYSIQANHLHLICEAADRESLTRGLQGLLIRIAKALNRSLDRRGRVFADRYHDRVLKTPREVRNALAYVLNNARKHAAERGRRYPRMWVDPCSSGLYFFGLRDRDGTLPAPRTWLMRCGWRRAGPVTPSEVPRGG